MHRKKGRKQLVQEIKKKVGDARIIAAFEAVDRAAFIPDGEEKRKFAYQNKVIPIDSESTMSQPTLVAEMLKLAEIKETDKVLEIGSGSGYSPALTSRLCSFVFTIEKNEFLAGHAAKKLKELGFKNVEVNLGDGAIGLPEEAPFDVIIATAAFSQIPEALIEQLKKGGKIVAPVGLDPAFSELVVGIKNEDGKLDLKKEGLVRFLPIKSKRQGGWD